MRSLEGWRRLKSLNFASLPSGVGSDEAAALATLDADLEKTSFTSLQSSRHAISTLRTP